MEHRYGQGNLSQKGLRIPSVIRPGVRAQGPWALSLVIAGTGMARNSSGRHESVNDALIDLALIPLPDCSQGSLLQAGDAIVKIDAGFNPPSPIIRGEGTLGGR
jgi:hypothetical protein